MSLHDRIINLPTDKRCPEDMPARLLYKQGHRDARHAAAEMTLEADELMGSLAAALGECQDALDSSINSDEAEYAQTVLEEYRRWRDKE